MCVCVCVCIYMQCYPVCMAHTNIHYLKAQCCILYVRECVCTCLRLQMAMMMLMMIRWISHTHTHTRKRTLSIAPHNQIQYMQNSAHVCRCRRCDRTHYYSETSLQRNRGSPKMQPTMFRFVFTLEQYLTVTRFANSFRS